MFLFRKVLFQLSLATASAAGNLLIKLQIIKTIAYFQRYFQTLDNVKQRKLLTLFKLKVVRCLVALKAAHFLWLVVNHDRLSPTEHMLHFNFFVLERLPSYISFFTALITLLAVKLLRVMYLGNHGLSSAVFRQILLESDHSFTVTVHYNFPLISQLSTFFPNNHLLNNNICTNLQMMSIALINTLQVVIVLLDLHIISVFIQVHRQLSFESSLQYFQLCICFLSTLANASTVLSTLILVGTFSLLLFAISYLRFRHFEAYLAAQNCFTFSRRRFAYFEAECVTSLRWMADTNAVYGFVFFLFTSLTLPINAIFTMLMLFGQVTGNYRVLVVIFVIHQVFFVVFSFIAAIGLSEQFHRPAKRLIGLFVKSPAVRQFRFRLRLAEYIERFHTNNHYGANFGGSGKISWQSFGKMTFYYVKYLIFFYKLVKYNSGTENF